jgi:hypothetical protein
LLFIINKFVLNEHNLCLQRKGCQFKIDQDFSENGYSPVFSENGYSPDFPENGYSPDFSENGYPQTFLKVVTAQTFHTKRDSWTTIFVSL